LVGNIGCQDNFVVFQFPAQQQFTEKGIDADAIITFVIGIDVFRPYRVIELFLFSIDNYISIGLFTKINTGFGNFNINIGDRRDILYIELGKPFLGDFSTGLMTTPYPWVYISL
jgi:hypothetical protein